MEKGGKKTSTVCPYLGWCTDRDTFAAYPSETNCCHRAHPPAPVTLSHQASFCLSDKYPNCPMYLQPEGSALPSNLRRKATQHETKQQNNKQWKAALVALAVVAISAILVLSITIVGKGRKASGGAVATPWPTFTFASEPTAQFTPTPIPTHIPTPTPMVTATLTLPPTLTPTSPPVLTPTQVVRKLETPLGPNGQFIIHRVRPGEGWLTLTERYHTSKEAIEALNALPSDQTLWEGLLIVIPVGVTDPTKLNTPPLKAYQVNETIRVEDLLAKWGVTDSELFEKINVCGPDDLLHPGDWVLVPHP